MKSIIQLVIGAIVAGSSVVLIVLMAFSELNYRDLTFGKYFALFITLAAVGFLVLLRNEDNEETNPAKEKRR